MIINLENTILFTMPFFHRPNFSFQDFKLSSQRKNSLIQKYLLLFILFALPTVLTFFKSKS